MYWGRKQKFSQNVQVAANEVKFTLSTAGLIIFWSQKRILDIDMGWPGSVHDSRVWALSSLKVWAEGQVEHK